VITPDGAKTALYRFISECRVFNRGYLKTKSTIDVAVYAAGTWMDALVVSRYFL
jgi:hypothetical protein